MTNYTQIPIHFVVGAARSGTTLLRTILNAHPHIYCTGEVRHTMAFYSTYGNQQPISEQFITNFKQYELLRFGNVGKKKEKKALLLAKMDEVLGDLRPQLPTMDYAQLSKYLLLNSSKIAEQKQVNVLMNKNPDYCFYIDELLKIHPEAKFLACIRDPRAVVLSHQEHKGFNDFSQYMGDSAAAVSYFWKWSNEAILAAQAKYPNKILLVPYEQMVTDKENLLHKICSFLDIEFDQAMLTHEQQQNTKNETPNNTANNINTNAPKAAAEWEQWKTDNRNQAVFTNRLAAWKQKLSTRNQEICNTISASTAIKLGYDTAPPSLLKQTWLLFSCLPQIALGYITTTLFIRHYFHLPFSWRLLLAKYLKVRK